MHMHCPHLLQDSTEVSKTFGKKKTKSIAALNTWKSVIDGTGMIKNLWTMEYRCDWIIATQSHEGESSSSSKCSTSQGSPRGSPRLSLAVK